MSDKHDVEPVHPGDFQIDKDAALKDVPLLARGVVGGLIDAINKLDMNHDGKRDIVQLAPIVIKALPLVLAVAEHVDVKGTVEWFVSHDFVKNKDAVRAILEEVLKLAEEAAKLAPKA